MIEEAHGKKRIKGIERKKKRKIKRERKEKNSDGRSP